MAQPLELEFIPPKTSISMQDYVGLVPGSLVKVKINTDAFWAKITDIQPDNSRYYNSFITALVNNDVFINEENICDQQIEFPVRMIHNIYKD